MARWNGVSLIRLWTLFYRLVDISRYLRIGYCLALAPARRADFPRNPCDCCRKSNGISITAKNRGRIRPRSPGNDRSYQARDGHRRPGAAHLGKVSMKRAFFSVDLVNFKKYHYMGQFLIFHQSRFHLVFDN